MAVRAPTDRPAVAGFTLTELAIVLAIIGLILGGIWAAVDDIYQNNKAKEAASEFLQIAQNYRKLYAQRGVDQAGWTDITCTGIKAGYFPPGMVPAGATACDPNAADADVVQAPWSGSKVRVFSYQGSNDIPGTNVMGIVVYFYDLPETGCAGLAPAVAGSPDIEWEAIDEYYGGTWIDNGTRPYTVAEATADCQRVSTDLGTPPTFVAYQPSNNFIQIMYKIK